MVLKLLDRGEIKRTAKHHDQVISTDGGVRIRISHFIRIDANRLLDVCRIATHFRAPLLEHIQLLAEMLLYGEQSIK